jgi:hypothetical protein
VYSDAGLSTLDSDAFTVYPNPNHGTFFIKNTSFEGTFQVQVMTVSGRTIQELQANGSNEIKLDVPTGTYLLQITTATHKSVRKLVVL